MFGNTQRVVILTITRNFQLVVFYNPLEQSLRQLHQQIKHGFGIKFTNQQAFITFL
jgi:hypothetical protein